MYSSTLRISQLVSNIGKHVWCQIKAEALFYAAKTIYANYLICIIMNINYIH